MQGAVLYRVRCCILPPTVDLPSASQQALAVGGTVWQWSAPLPSLPILGSILEPDRGPLATQADRVSMGRYGNLSAKPKPPPGPGSAAKHRGRCVVLLACGVLGNAAPGKARRNGSCLAAAAKWAWLCAKKVRLTSIIQTLALARCTPRDAALSGMASHSTPGWAHQPNYLELPLAHPLRSCVCCSPPVALKALLLTTFLHKTQSGLQQQNPSSPSPSCV
ncbi:hypothetical protein K431DRAFT_154345 [Polychaeton citri CBS 116435]|uniref:Uncharacterized protein n=1 Tax=Polychaeton citri CBS 116435 TaxID=1314669 RepID=A0A9P4QG08_9PEZI|nr:hypothetical protein K431DRAFT_154345 [Polychaeton citri CBS 116435]